MSTTILCLVILVVSTRSATTVFSTEVGGDVTADLIWMSGDGNTIGLLNTSSLFHIIVYKRISLTFQKIVVNNVAVYLMSGDAGRPQFNYDGT